MQHTYATNFVLWKDLLLPLFHNFASSKSLEKNGFNAFASYAKSVSKEDFVSLSSQDFFSETGKMNAEKTLEKFADTEEIVVDYNLYIKKM